MSIISSEVNNHAVIECHSSPGNILQFPPSSKNMHIEADLKTEIETENKQEQKQKWKLIQWIEYRWKMQGTEEFCLFLGIIDGWMNGS